MSDEVVVCVRRMAELCQLSRSRFYELIESGVFPQPVHHPTSNRPMFDRELQDKCLEIRRSGIGANGLPVLFNRKPKAVMSKPKADRLGKRESDPFFESLLAALKGLGITPSSQAVSEAVAVVYPTGVAGLDQGDVIRKVFLHLQTRKK